MAKAQNNPKEGGKSESEAPSTTKASFLLKTTLLKKLRYISVVDETTQTDIIDHLLSEYVEKWEKKNGPIPMR